MCQLKARSKTLKSHSTISRLLYEFLKPWGNFFFFFYTRPIKWAVHITINTCATMISHHLSLLLSVSSSTVPLSVSSCLTSVQESQQRSADFRFYIENHTRNPDDLSRKQVRIYQLYSRTTGKHVQILGKKVNANGDDGGKYGMGELLCISLDI